MVLRLAPPSPAQAGTQFLRPNASIDWVPAPAGTNGERSSARRHDDRLALGRKGDRDTAGAGQDAEIFDFATDADNTQRAEIKIMEGMLKLQTSEEKR